MVAKKKLSADGSKRAPQVLRQNIFSMNGDGGDDDDNNTLSLQCCHHQCSARVKAHAGPYDVGNTSRHVPPSCPTTVRDAERTQPFSVLKKDQQPFQPADCHDDGGMHLTARNMGRLAMEYASGGGIENWIPSSTPVVVANNYLDYLVQPGHSCAKSNKVRGSSVSSHSLAGRLVGGSPGPAKSNPTDHDVSGTGGWSDVGRPVQGMPFTTDRVLDDDVDWLEFGYGLDEEDEDDLNIDYVDGSDVDGMVTDRMH